MTNRFQIAVILILSLQPSFTRADPHPFGPSFHPTFEEIHETFMGFTQSNPEMVQRKPLITTPGKRPLDIFSVGNPRAKKRLLLLCNHHGDEQWVAQLCVDFTKYLLFAKESDANLKALLSKVVLDVLPVGNPDGFARGGRYNLNGNDLNRNFPFMWGYTEPGSVNTHPGPKALSEPESKALYDYQMAHHGQWLAIFNYHLRYPDSDEQNYILLPWAYTKKKLLTATEKAKYEAYLPTKEEAPSFIIDTVPNVFYPCSGVHTDWTWNEFGAPSVTMELGHGYELPSREVYLSTHLKENLPVFLRFLKGAAVGYSM